MLALALEMGAGTLSMTTYSKGESARKIRLSLDGKAALVLERAKKGGWLGGRKEF